MDFTPVLAAKGYSSARPLTQPAPGTASEKRGGFAAAAAADFVQTLKTGEQTAKSAMITEADPHALVQALAKTELAVETAVTVRNKIVEAYQEILRMPV
ncbi:flagellar hook-basal body complex protein FliE [Rhodovulum imhoffii]|uniref:Flagellar hook-basal body complex protein FliE n=1 Tax=Rhodovulum imhoffii TaxID=365340 RepID=A0A2T5BRQ7_9RHOB|nr:flagellar hook-basal body complex protein FliE [Rhodovulum imhoffii]MBK5934085.1 flagellar hook-basal body protein FliE [Rhodovulum imhoffii]PTN01970.1 flagellar hook-basal body complex protein FliE [Rhodovulum imhoffii]